MAARPRSDDELRDLHGETEQRRLDLIRTDLELCRTLCGIVDSELAYKDRDHASRTLAHANKGYADIQHIFEQRKFWEARITNEIKTKLAELRQRLDLLQGRVHPIG